MRRLFFSMICLYGLLHPLPAISQTQPPTQSLAPHVDERVELLSIVFRLAGSSEYNMNTLRAYSSDIDHYFAAYKSHPAVQMAHALADKNDVGFDAVMVMAVYLSPPPELKPLIPFTKDIPDGRWGSSSETFLPLLRDFYRDTRFANFYAAHQPMYHLAEQRFAATLQAVNLAWYPRFYGNGPTVAYHLILGMNNGAGNYGPRLLRPNQPTELFSIMGCWTHDDAGDPIYPPDQGYLATIIHEFNHSFVNPVVADHWKDFSGAQQVYATVADPMQRLAYGNAQTMVDESLVRAAVIIYFQQNGEDTRKNLKRIREEQRLGFFWMDRLVALLHQYQAQRSQYLTFASFLPQIISFYRDLAPHASEDQAAFAAKSVKVVALQPFTNHEQQVDASTQRLTVTLDKPLDPSAGYSIDTGMDGAEHFPISGTPTFSPDALHILLPLRLKPNQTYSFVLSPAAFATADGYPLATYKIDFKTK